MLSQMVAVTGVNFRSIRQRLGSSAVAITGIAGVVVVFLGVLSIAEGFKAAMSSVGDPQTAGPLSTTPVLVTAHASARDVKANVVSSRTSVAGIGADHIRSTTSQTLDKSRLLLRSEVILTGVGLPGGLHIDEVRSVAEVVVLLV